jgi:hypothetical protein
MATHNGNRITQRGGADAGRGDEPHGTGRRILNTTATFRGNEGSTHLFSSEATKGQASDSIPLQLDPNSKLQVGAMYHIDTTPGKGGFHPTPIAAAKGQEPGVSTWSPL